FCKTAFNAAVKDSPDVAYYSFGAAAGPRLRAAGAADRPPPARPAVAAAAGFWNKMLSVPHSIVEAAEGENDGLVSVNSAKWGRYVETLEASHFDINGRQDGRVVEVAADGGGGGGRVVRVVRRSGSREERKPRFDSIEFYARVATMLHRDGF
ncbi:MAG: hypothetical protein BJ554DRAFT_4215, partial [Olpidium bornovanus]